MCTESGDIHAFLTFSVNQMDIQKKPAITHNDNLLH